MFQVNDIVLYSSSGVCKITEITQKEIGNQKIDYYVLKPVYENRSTVFVPTKNEALLAKMRRLLSKEEIYALIREMPEEELIWIEDDAERKEEYRKLLLEGDRRQLVKLIKTLYLHQQKRLEAGKRVHIADSQFLREAEEALYNEFAYVLGLKREEVLPFIVGQIEQAEG